MGKYDIKTSICKCFSIFKMFQKIKANTYQTSQESDYSGWVYRWIESIKHQTIKSSKNYTQQKQDETVVKGMNMQYIKINNKQWQDEQGF